MHSVIPGILEKNAEDLEKKLSLVKSFSRNVHIDFLDGKFSPEMSFLGVDFFKKYKNDFNLEAHLMVENPTQYIKSLAESGFKKFLGHVEKMENLDEFIALSQIYGEVGIAIDLDTKIDSLKIPYDDLDLILIMSVKAGKSGQEFMPEALEKVLKIHEVSQIPIEIDGGVNDKTIVKAKESGVQSFVATSFIFNSQDPIKSYELLTSLC